MMEATKILHQEVYHVVSAAALCPIEGALRIALCPI